MARDTRKAYEDELARLAPQVRRAFLDAIADIRSNAKISLVEEAVSAGDWGAVVEILRIDERVFDGLDRQIANVFLQGGLYQMAHLGSRGAALAVRFQGRHERAERIARTLGSSLVTEVIVD